MPGTIPGTEDRAMNETKLSAFTKLPFCAKSLSIQDLVCVWASYSQTQVQIQLEVSHKLLMHVITLQFPQMS